VVLRSARPRRRSRGHAPLSGDMRADVRASIDRSRSFRHRHRTTLPPDMIEVFVAVHGEPLQAALPGASVHDRSGRSSGIRPRCLHRCLHLVPPILKPAFAWHRPKESNGCLFTRSAHTTSTLTQGRSPWRHERSHRTTISLGPSSTPVDGDCALLRPLPPTSPARGVATVILCPCE